MKADQAAEKARKEMEAKEEKARQDAELKAKRELLLSGQTITLAEENNSGESGIASLSAKGKSVIVTVNLKGTPSGISQPAHIHIGECPGVGEVKYPLTALVNGKSTTTIDVSMEDLITQTPLAINVHKSKTDIKTYVSCGIVDGIGGSLKTSPMVKPSAAQEKISQ